MSKTLNWICWIQVPQFMGNAVKSPEKAKGQRVGPSPAAAPHSSLMQKLPKSSW